ncbi:probable inactive serine/threonine-protein kinase DDB_G0278909 [Sarcophilus harrisii]|nr:probable inactive serine/threonine-protein kinase DDB_G0278909 [Sarcophilus harrisii]
MFVRLGKKSLVVLDRKDRLELVKQAHVTSSGLHCSLQETRKKVSFSYYWPSLDRDVTKWVKQCSCRQKTGAEKSLPIQGASSKSQRTRDPLPVLQVEAVTQAFEQVGLGLVGPLMETANGFRFILLSVDAYSRWVEASPLKEQNPVEVASALIPFLLRFGRPQLLVTTLRVPFVSQVNRSLHRQLQGLGVPLGKLDIIVSAFQPKINSILSLTASSVRRALWNLVKGELEKWDQVLDRALFSLRTAVTKNKRKSPFQLLYGRKPRAPQDVPSYFDVVAADTVGDSAGATHGDKGPAGTVAHAAPKSVGQQPKRQIIREPTLQVMAKPTVEAVQQPIMEPVQQPVPEPAQQPIMEPVQQPVPEPAHQPMLEPSQQPMPELTQQPMPELTHLPMPELVLQPMPEPSQQFVLEPSQQPMLESSQQFMLEPSQQPISESRQPSRPEGMGQFVHQLIPEPINQHMWQPMLGPINQPIHQPIQQFMQQSMIQSLQQPMHQPIQQLILQPIQQPMMESIQQPLHQPLMESIQQPLHQPIQQSGLQPMSQTMQRPVPQCVQWPMAQSIQQPIQQLILAKPMHPPVPRLAECPVVSGWDQRTTPSLDNPWEKWEPGGGAFWTQWREPGN